MAIKEITPPTIEPVSLVLAKHHLRVDGSDDDVFIQSLIAAARRSSEKATNRAYSTRTLELILDRWPREDHINLPAAPVQSVTSLKYKDSAGTEVTVDAADYVVDADSEPGRIVLAYGKSWPSTVLYPAAAIRVRYVAGYRTYSGTVTVDGSAVARTEGDVFNTSWTAGKVIAIAGEIYTMASVTDADTLTVDGAPAEGEDKAYSTCDIPEDLVAAILLRIGHWYENREAVLVGSISKAIEFATEALEASYHVWGADYE